MQEALENFKRSIANSENRCVSAINAAVCCLNLKREKDFNYYINMAQLLSPPREQFPDVFVLLRSHQLLQRKLSRSTQCLKTPNNRRVSNNTK
jgi:hypothetical protein